MILKNIEPKTIVKKGKVVTPEGIELNRVTVMGPIIIKEDTYGVRVYGREAPFINGSPWMFVKEVYDRNQREILLSNI